jgi:hypothetical protein
MEKINYDFAEYISILRNGSNNPLIKKFDRTFKDVYSDEIPLLSNKKS